MPKVNKVIVTTYFANVHKVIEEVYAPYSIAQTQPTNFSIETFSLFVPSSFCRSLAAQRRFKDYEREYKRVNLNGDRLPRVVEDIAALHSHKVAFVCWEGKDKFCHRHLVADYLNRHKFCDMEVREF